MTDPAITSGDRSQGDGAISSSAHNGGAALLAFGGQIGSGGLGQPLLAHPLAGESVGQAGQPEVVHLLARPACAVSSVMPIEGILKRPVERLGVGPELAVDCDVRVGLPIARTCPLLR
jgi:hypothetical protein